MRSTGRMTTQRAMSMLARGLHEASDDLKMLQQFKGGGLFGEAFEKIERFQNYGMSAIPHGPNQGNGSGGNGGGGGGGGGGINPLQDAGWAAEHLIQFFGGNRSMPVVTAIDDRRHRPRGMEPGESFQYDDQGMGTLIRRAATFIIGGGYDNSGARQGNGGSSAESRFASLRHVIKQHPGFPQMGQQQQANGAGGGQSGSSSGSSDGAQGYKHEGDSPTSELQVQHQKMVGKADEIIKHQVGEFHSVAAKDHVAICKGKVAVWIDKDGNIFSTKPIQQKAYPYSDSADMMSGGGGGGGGGGG